MTASITALLAFAGWTLLLPVLYAGYRGVVALGGKRPVNSWPRGHETPTPGVFTGLSMPTSTAWKTCQCLAQSS